MVISTPGKHVDQGVLSLKQAIGETKEIKKAVLYYQTSSLGSLNNKFLESFGKALFPNAQCTFKVLFPTKSYI